MGGRLEFYVQGLEGFWSRGACLKEAERVD